MPGKQPFLGDRRPRRPEERAVRRRAPPDEARQMTNISRPGGTSTARIPLVVAFAKKHVKGKDERERAVSLYYAVRDEIRYNPFLDFSDPEVFRASAVLEAGEGFCVGKASLLAACARAAGIEARRRLRRREEPPHHAAACRDHGQRPFRLPRLYRPAHRRQAGSRPRRRSTSRCARASASSRSSSTAAPTRSSIRSTRTTGATWSTCATAGSTPTCRWTRSSANSAPLTRSSTAWAPTPRRKRFG